MSTEILSSVLKILPGAYTKHEMKYMSDPIICQHEQLFSGYNLYQKMHSKIPLKQNFIQNVKIRRILVLCGQIC